MTFCHYYQLQQRSGSGSDLLPDHFFEWDRDRDLDRFLGKDRDRDLVRFFRDRSIAWIFIIPIKFRLVKHDETFFVAAKKSQNQGVLGFHYHY